MTSFARQWDAYLKLHEKAFEHAARNETDAAMAIYNGEALQLFNSLSDDAREAR